MVSFVYRPRVRGKQSALWSGRYRFDDMAKPVTVPLRTADELVARKRLQDLINRLQRQSEGLAPGEPMRAAMNQPFPAVVTDYAADLRAQGRRPQHAKDTGRRLLRLARECGWPSIGHATPASFTKWRAAVVMSAKTRKEYQVSLNAFFRWLQATERYDRNPFARVRLPETRGQQVRRRRAFTLAEATRLLNVAEHRRLPYLFLLYTGCRYREGWGLLWGDVHFTGPNGPYILIRAEATKDKEKRAIPMHPVLFSELLALPQLCPSSSAKRDRWLEGLVD
jgi:integrase